MRIEYYSIIIDDTLVANFENIWYISEKLLTHSVHQSLEHRTRKRRVSCIVYSDTYTVILGLQFSIVVQQNFINFSHNLAKFLKIVLNFPKNFEAAQKFANFLKF